MFVIPSLRNKLLIAAALVVVVITACVQLPNEDVSAVPAQAAKVAPVPDSAEPDSTEPDSAEEEVAEDLVPASDTAQTSEGEIAADISALVADSTQGSSASQASVADADKAAVSLAYVEQLCNQIGNKLGSVSVDDCIQQDFRFSGGFSINQRPLVIKEVAPQVSDEKSFRVFLMGGIHGDEYSSISIIFKWLELFSPDALEGDFHWRIAPLVNPDGLLDDGQAKRQNANGVDLNRNFPSMDWDDSAAEYWQENTGSNPRRFPGSSAGSEPEVQWIIGQIEQFNPDVIVSIHAPYHLLDFDGPANAPHQIGELYLHQLGVYPGSLGNYAGLNKRIPVVTLELPSAGILPPAEQIRLMWQDLVSWLDTEGRKVLTN